MFCPKCGSMLRPKQEKDKKVMACSCGYKSSDKIMTDFKEKINHKEIEVVEEVETHPLTDAICDKCGHKKAHYWGIQTRASDEPETRFFKCEKCKHTWREYS